MDIFPCIFVDGGKVDLDDLSIYPKTWLDLNIRGLWQKAEQRAGESLFYMGFLRTLKSGWGDQEKRVHEFCKELASMFPQSFDNSDENKLKLLKWLFKFADEVENQV